MSANCLFTEFSVFLTIRAKIKWKELSFLTKKSMVQGLTKGRRVSVNPFRFKGRPTLSHLAFPYKSRCVKFKEIVPFTYFSALALIKICNQPMINKFAGRNLRHEFHELSNKFGTNFYLYGEFFVLFRGKVGGFLPQRQHFSGNDIIQRVGLHHLHVFCPFLQ